MSKMYRIGEVSKITGVSESALRHYDKENLLSPKRQKDNQYRVYDEEDIKRIRKIKLFKNMGFELEIIKHMLDNPEPEEELFEKNEQFLQNKIETLQRQIDFSRIYAFLGTDFIVKISFITNIIKTWSDIFDFPCYRELMKRKDSITKEEIDTLIDFFKKFAEQNQENLHFSSARPQKTAQECYAYFSKHFAYIPLEILPAIICFIGSGGLLTSYIDEKCGKYTSRFAAKAFLIFCEKNGIKIRTKEEEELCHE